MAVLSRSRESWQLHEGCGDSWNIRRRPAAPEVAQEIV